MRIGVPKESLAGETRVAATPKTVGQLIGLGYEVTVESGAGRRAAFSDAAYEEAGATVAEDVWGADIILKINAPDPVEIDRLHRGQTIACLLAPALNPDLVERLARAGVTALAMDAVPRISRAQALDVLSSMANIAGYRAVVEAAHEFGSLFTGQVTAAGKVPPAKVLVVGAGVAGLAAIGTASSLGAIVRAFDARSEVGEQVESMGAEFLRIDIEDTGPSADGYARETGEDFDRKAAQLYAEQAEDVDIIITTALIPGRPAPRLITEEMVASMRPGSVIVDLAAANGGNVAGSRAGEIVTTENGIRIIGYTDLAGRLPTQASQLFGTNLVNLLKLLTPDKDGQLRLDLDDVVQRGMTVARDGEVLWPPPPVQVSAAPAAAPAPVVEPKVEKPKDPRRRYVAMALAAVVFALVASVSPSAFLGHFTVFALAVIVGYYVISNVAHALHTPLMSETNAISGIIVVGALLQVGSDNWLVSALAFIGIVVASINIFGGFAVTYRMLQMFRKG
ncbi:pyridine nucleotide transhydrogenase, alpha subunit [Nostocoides japonicum T1-X7]|uniref:NAD(P) transhydrogenase subunit alpha n=1 Tax=Nostocoides japonicum T1-X7 TaxID=1194083 RepID=A0A077M720_9MICO|nr:Re/Si-specific NAD(P)(+) transhydrogenase subunit alpha [Tetrasphaera japonica]CCH79845.1 pyridine nucleotide transhydrogenase, alpha subunit [Tetrasphaera japonica T1-X7]